MHASSVLRREVTTATRGPARTNVLAACPRGSTVVLLDPWMRNLSYHYEGVNGILEKESGVDGS